MEGNLTYKSLRRKHQNFRKRFKWRENDVIGLRRIFKDSGYVPACAWQCCEVFEERLNLCRETFLVAELDDVRTTLGQHHPDKYALCRTRQEAVLRIRKIYN